MFNIIVKATGSEAGNCTIISDGWTTIMIDAGAKYEGVVHNGIKALLITHNHL